MKYHTLSTSSLSSENKKSTLTIYTGPEFIREKMGSSETAIIRCELEMAQRALKLQTRRCRQLVSEYTRKLQAKEVEIISEHRLRDEQLTKVLRSLLVFEARLKQEQTFIRHQLEEKDDIIRRQKRELRGLRSTVQYCKTCSQFYSGANIDSGDSSTEYYVNWESGSELYGSISEFSRLENSSGEDSQKQEEFDEEKVIYEKHNKFNYNQFKRIKKSNNYRRTTGTYLEVLKSQESSAESSPEDMSSDLNNDSQKTQEEIEKVSERIEELFSETSRSGEESFSDKMDSLHGIKKEKSQSPNDLNYSQFSNKLTNSDESINSSKSDLEASPVHENQSNEEQEMSLVEINTMKNRNISETITVFDAGDSEQNDSWYVSASDPEDNEQRDIYRNNPVLECMNQILLQNINDPIISPPKSPELDRNSKNKATKRVKFSDENNTTIEKPIPIKMEEVIDNNGNNQETEADYYETPIQGGANFYEVPQSIYSNDYEQILSKCSGDSVHNWSPRMTSPTSKIENQQENKINKMSAQKLTIAKCNSLNELEDKSNYYIDMDTTYPMTKNNKEKKTRSLRTPPALPPKPANLISKFKIQSALQTKSLENIEDLIADSEPDYCSISELNLPPEKIIISNGGQVTPSVAELANKKIPVYDPISLDKTITNLMSPNIEKTNFIQAPKQVQVKNERINSTIASIAQINMLKTKIEPEIPKLPQVSEIIIPEETESTEKVDYITQDNYIKNNSQLLKQKISPNNNNEKIRNRIMIGTSVSNLVSNFNNQYKLAQQFKNNRKLGSERYKLNEKQFSSVDYIQDYEKQQKTPDKVKNETPNFEKFDLSQNFEEFNLDDCEIEIGEEYQSETSNSLTYNVNDDIKSEIITEPVNNQELNNLNTSVEIVRATKDIHPHNVHQLQQIQKTLSNHRIENNFRESDNKVPVITRNPEPSYEHFLECTGLSSKSILTPSRMLSNHKSMLKPKDIKLRSRVKSTIFEHSSGNGKVKYWSEPYL